MIAISAEEERPAAFRRLARCCGSCYEIEVDRRCFRKGGALSDDITGIVSSDSGAGLGEGDGRIRCPLCRWHPKKTDRWQCVCSHIWHAFETRGRCPECANQWHVMQCLRCAEWSPHRAWYG